MVMDRNEVDRLRREFERLYQQANFEQPGRLDNIDRRHLSTSERSQGWQHRLQQFWQALSRFFADDLDDSPQNDPLWWHVHSWRMGVYAPLFTDETADGAKDWLEGLYDRSANDTDQK
jgi:hypothetical protein